MSAATATARASVRRRPVAVAVGLAVLSVVSTAASLPMYGYNLRHAGVPVTYVYGDAVAGLVYPLVGALLVRRRPDSLVGWVFVATSVLGINAFANQYAVLAILVHPGLPLSALAAWIAAWGWTPTLVVPALLPLLFPDGRLASPLWRRYAVVVVVVVAVVVLVFMTGAHPIDATERITNPLGWIPARLQPLMIAPVLVTIFVVTPISVVSLAVRLRRSRGVERAQLAWLTLGAVVAIVAAVSSGILPSGWGELSWVVASLAIPAGVVVAVVRHQLLDIEVVLNRTIVYLVLSGVVLAGYAVAVLGVGEAAGRRVGLVAVAALALVVASGRARVQGWVDRALFGHRHDPYAVVTRVGRGLDLATGPHDALVRLVEELREALRLPYVAVVPFDPALPAVESGRAVAGTRNIPVAVLGEQVGVLRVGERDRAGRFRSEEESAVADVARRAGSLVQAAALLADVRRSRERIVVAREEERRRLRHDLHDGVGPQLAGMALQLDSLAARLAGDPALAERASRLRDRLRATVVEVRRVVDDLRPPALDQLGLAEALRQQVALHALEERPVEVVVPDPLPPLPAAVEVAAYRIAGEAVANAVRHSRGRSCRVLLAVRDGALLVEVCDDGRGIPADAVPHVGLHSMRERAEEIGGALDLDTGPGGTAVRARFPLEGQVPAVNDRPGGVA